MRDVPLQPRPLEWLQPLIGSDRYAALDALAAKTRDRVEGRVLWNINSTATGGGVAEMLKVLVGYALGTGLAARWLVIDGDPEFFAITKRLHNCLHGVAGDGGPLGQAEHRHYAAVLQAQVPALERLIGRQDVVILHDPQTAGLVEPLAALGATVIWRCHIGRDTPNPLTEHSWRFLRPDLDAARALVFSRAAYVPPWVAPERVAVMAPSIDPFSAKNQLLDEATVQAVLARIGLLEPTGAAASPAFQREDGSTGVVERAASTVTEGLPLPPDVPLVVQVSRWDHLKDMEGVLEGFACHATADGVGESHLALVGPSVEGVTDDPEGQQVLDECVAAWRRLPPAQRRRVSLVSLPMTDGEENAAMVNAIQRHAMVVVQKSLAEGFGLTVAEAMWKARPVVASAIGGIQDQITADHNGLLLADPCDLAAFGSAVQYLLDHPDDAARMGRAAQQRVTELFLPDRHLTQWAHLLDTVLG